MTSKVSLSPIEYRSTDELIGYVNNVKLHPDGQIDQIISSIAEYNFLDPIAVDEENVILEGHGRLAAAKKMGLVEVPVVQVKGLTEAQKKGYRLTHNKLTMNSGFDSELLKLELDALAELDFDIDLTGFDTTELNELLQRESGEHDESGADEDEVPDVDEVEPRCKLGEIWQLGRHRILCGDSTDEQQVRRLLGNSIPDMVFTDPPYNCADEMSVSFYANTNSGAMKELSKTDWDKGFDINKFLKCLSVFRPHNGTVYICTSQMLAPDIWRWMASEKAKHNSYCVWTKPNPMPSLAKRYWTWATELICFATFGKHTFNFPEQGHALNWWNITSNSANRLHPTQKPVAIPRHAIAHSSNPKDLIVDFFLGSGTTLIAGEESDRTVYGVELSEHYVEICIQRYEKMTGDTAHLIDSFQATIA